MEYLVKNSAYRKHLFAKIKQLIEAENNLAAIRYIKLSGQTVRVLCYTPEILSQIDRQLTYTSSENSKQFDATIVVWQEVDIRNFLGKINEQFDLRKNMRLRLDTIICRKLYISMRENIHSNSTFFEVDDEVGHIRAYDMSSKTCYVAWKSMKTEDLMKDGHLFVQQLYRICNTKFQHVVHGATVGLNGKGILFCARGGCGKSTLTVKALTEGFEYVSDDYLLLNKKDNKIFASPIYSVITLSPKMYQLMGDGFIGEFLSLNARGDKSVFNIAAYHEQFRENYPLKMLMFPHIVSDNESSIEPMNKGKALAQLIHSTIVQTGDIYNTHTVQKLLGFLKCFPCYQINLSPDIAKNVQCLRQFLTTYEE